MTRRAVGRIGLVAATVGAVGALTLMGVRSASRLAEAGEAEPDRVAIDRTADAALAARTVERLELFRAGGTGVRLSLTADEVTALLRHAVPGMLPGGVADPLVRLKGGIVVVEARLAPDAFPGSDPLASVLGAVPDTIDVDLSGRLASRPGRLVFTIERARASGIPLPRKAVAAIVGALADQAGDRMLPADADASLSLRWPDGMAKVAVVGDRLVLDRREPIADRAVDGS